MKIVCFGPMTTPSSEQHNYNCYGYALQGLTGRWEDITPPRYTIGMTVDQLAECTIRGITENGGKGLNLGILTDNELQTQINSLKSNEYIIALRVSPTDFHFMRYDKSQRVWQHKPGRAGFLLQLVGITSNNDVAWTIM